MFTAKQLSALKGILYLKVNNDRVIVSGHAVTTLKGTLAEVNE
ncbi:hypothetical protein [Paenibacillus abyssi]|nr:hypothetical protein [Paenibacillus abyssi]